MAAVAAGRTDVLRRIGERPATQHAETARRWACRVADNTPVHVHRIPVLAPLPNVAVHVEQTPTVGCFLADRVCCSTGVGVVPGVFA